ncbi:uncharacterized protein N7484_011351 [Penicillium longicatenatum]|uniref:uncharacterized protein n=1 Tax=Penicillium longicatenatum TaxID=1561947 RepID=UPI00254788C8|nr:uncharacterized protein N7484_011351 [Penicillium longicatenatum]KAJ5631251.1 hypothetical protein N7484_011351 [Penicillium longicatenatum]
MSTPTSVESLSSNIESIDPTSSKPHHDTIISRIKEHLRRTQKKWGPLMAAKECWDDEYNFSPGRYAGQDDRPIISDKW